MTKNYKEHLIDISASINDALIKLNELGIDSIVFVVDEKKSLVGSITDGDIRRGLIKGLNINDNVLEIIQPNPKFILKDDDNIDKIKELRENNYRIIPVLSRTREIIGILNFRESKAYLPIDVVIMAGGRGQRLVPLTNDVPKPMLKISNKPILEHNIDRFKNFGIIDYWISVNYLSQKIKDHFHDGRQKEINIRYIDEEFPLGTIGAVSKINSFIHDYVLVMNSDILTNLDYEEMFSEIIKHNADVIIAAIPYNVKIPYAVLEINESKQVINLSEKPTYTYFSNAGIYIFKRHLLKQIPTGVFYNTTDLIEKLIKNNHKIIYYSILGYWCDIGSHEDYNKAQKDFNGIKF